MEHQLREQCADLETASKYLLHKKKMVVGVIGLKPVKALFLVWNAVPSFAGDKKILIWWKQWRSPHCLLCWLP